MQGWRPLWFCCAKQDAAAAAAAALREIRTRETDITVPRASPHLTYPQLLFRAVPKTIDADHKNAVHSLPLHNMFPLDKLLLSADVQTARNAMLTVVKLGLEHHLKCGIFTRTRLGGIRACWGKEINQNSTKQITK